MKHWGTVYIETDTLILRRFTLDDVEPMYRNWASDPEVTRYLYWKTHYGPNVTREVIRDWILQYKSVQTYIWAIVPKDVGEPVGSISVVDIHEHNETVEFGYCIGQDWWHQGITSTALQVLIQFFFDKVGVYRITVNHMIENENSGKVLQKCHMRQEGVMLKAGKATDGKFHDLVNYALLKEEYESIMADLRKKVQ